MTTLDHIVEILGRLISFDTTSHHSNIPLIAYVEDYLSAFDCRVFRVESEGGKKANLFVSFGPQDRAGYVLSGHSDTVPAPNWTVPGSPYELRREGDKLYGRGTSDMKGFVAACLAQAPLLSRAALKTPIHIAISHDEEVGCVGVRTLLPHIADMLPKPCGCVVGEPTSMRAVIGHKGKRAFRTVIKARSGHSSRAPEYVNAIEYAARLVEQISTVGVELSSAGARDELYDIPHSTILTTLIDGGGASNIVPEQCSLVWEIRTIAADEHKGIPENIIRFAREKLEPEMKDLIPESSIAFEEIMAYPGLDTDIGDPIVRLAQSLARSEGVAKVAFGTEGGLFSRDVGLPTVVIGPGSIAQAHTSSEYIEMSQLERCGQFLANLVEHCIAG